MGGRPADRLLLDLCRNDVESRCPLIRWINLTETGCYALRPYSETFALANASVEFRNYLQKGRDQSEMVVKTADNARPIVVDLFKSKFPANLLRFAPDIMAA